MACCVPQGTIHGQKLFLLCINYICNESNMLRFILLADDSNIFKDKNIDVMHKIISV